MTLIAVGGWIAMLLVVFRASDWAASAYLRRAVRRDRAARTSRAIAQAMAAQDRATFIAMMDEAVSDLRAMLDDIGPPPLTDAEINFLHLYASEVTGPRTTAEDRAEWERMLARGADGKGQA